MYTSKLPAVLLLFCTHCVSADPGAALQPGASVRLAGRSATVIKLDALPFVQNEYTARFRFDSAANPKLKELRERYELQTVVAPGRDELEKQTLLLDWVHHQFKKFGPASKDVKGALEILQAIQDGHTFNCSQYAQLFVSAAASLGWVDRELALRRHQDSPAGGSTEHSVTEIWSNQHRKWIMLDPTANMHILKDGVPLNAWEIRQEWFYGDGRDLVFVIGKDHKAYRKANLPIFLARFARFGDLTVPADELDKYGFIGYIPNTDIMDSGLDYGKMFITKDTLCDGTRWHTRPLPVNPAVDPYFPMGQAAVELVPENGELTVTFRTMTPNLKTFEVRLDGRQWVGSGATFRWPVTGGRNKLEARAVNEFGVTGPISTIEVEVRNRPN
jgi:hypothetical protein